MLFPSVPILLIFDILVLRFARNETAEQSKNSPNREKQQLCNTNFDVN